MYFPSYHKFMIYCPLNVFVFITVCYKKLLSLYRVVKEEISDDNAKLPCFNGRVVSWVGSDCMFVSFHSCFMIIV